MSKQLPPCPCGTYHEFAKETRRFIRRVIKRSGRDLLVTTPDGSWWVPRIFIAAHGVQSVQVPALATLYGWPKEGSP